MSHAPDAALLLDALRFASAKHRDQRRRDSCASPFVNHPIETAWLLARAGGVRDITTLVSAILHDVLEETRTTPADLERRFGVAVRQLVEEVTDEPGLTTDDRRRRQVTRAARASCPARQIRLADKIANLRGLPVHWSRTDCEKYVNFAEQVAAAVRGANAHLDGVFLQVAQRARMALPEAGGNGLRAPRIPATPVDLGNGADETDDLLRLLQKWHGKGEELLDRLVMGRGGVNRRGPTFEPPAVVNRVGSKGRQPRPRRSADPVFRRLAEPGVGSVDLRKLDKRHVLVSIDGAKEFPAPLGLAHLLAVIAFVDRESDDGFTPFQSRLEVAARIEKLTGRASADHTIIVAIGRLRDLLQETGRVSPLLVETCPKRGVRLRLRRRVL